jgi:hypothetical protein
VFHDLGALEFFCPDPVDNGEIDLFLGGEEGEGEEKREESHRGKVMEKHVKSQKSKVKRKTLAEKANQKSKGKNKK